MHLQVQSLCIYRPNHYVFTSQSICIYKFNHYVFTGSHKVNTIDDFFHVGFTWDRHAEFMPRPIIISAMEICSQDVVEFMLNFGADLAKEYEGQSILTVC